MAKEWYLMNANYDTISGFESDDFRDLASDAFNELLATHLGSDVEICNCDLSERIQSRVIIQGNIQDTKLKTMQRVMLAPIDTCKAGQYVYYKNRYWLIVGLVDNNGMYEKAVLALCNHLLTWKNEDGRIIQRWANISSASHGETGNKFYSIRSDQLIILTPDDNDSLLIKHGQRFIIDRRCKVYEKSFSSGTNVNTSKQLITYQLTRMDNVFYDYQDSGHSEFIASQDEQHESDGYYVIGGKGYWLCDAPDLKNKTSILSCSIECDEPEIYSGIEPCIFYAKFYDSCGNIVNVLPKWEINCDFEDSLNIEYVENSISISVDDNALINKSFELSLCAEGYEKTAITVEIKAFI